MQQKRCKPAGSAMSTSIYDGFFKKTPEGYLFRAPNPWLFGAGKHYLANDAQRAEILELGRVRLPVVYALVFALVIIACPAGSTLLVYLLSGHAEPAGADIAAIAILTSLSLLTSLLIVARLRLRRLRPILMRLPRARLLNLIWWKLLVCHMHASAFLAPGAERN